MDFSSTTLKIAARSVVRLIMGAIGLDKKWGGFGVDAV